MPNILSFLGQKRSKHVELHSIASKSTMFLQSNSMEQEATAPLTQQPHQEHTWKKDSLSIKWYWENWSPHNKVSQGSYVSVHQQIYSTRIQDTSCDMTLHTRRKQRQSFKILLCLGRPPPVQQTKTNAYKHNCGKFKRFFTVIKIIQPERQLTQWDIASYPSDQRAVSKTQ